MPDQPLQDAAEAALPPSLRFLKWLVILLTLTMIVGVITIVAVLVTRIPQTFGRIAPDAPVGPTAPAGLTLPGGLSLPDGLTAGAVTMGRGWVAVVATDSAGAEQILIFGADGALRQRVPIATDAETP